eukprot:TRINITY_DN5643_c0_g2_i1.p1 TRINITY_DN5643_c0_g2~~TRINITY_DN5643_c0_g2_i1.p1  ORF type:complete len:304 (+),score=57.38 TRINITY_DN5643_c0_g2_i1:89-1000(+)
MTRQPPRSTLSSSSAASDVYKRQGINAEYMGQLKSLENQKLQLIQSIFKCSTESPLPLAKAVSLETEDPRISESSTIIPMDNTNSMPNPMEKESHLYQKMTSLLSNNGSLYTLSIICQEELGKLDKMSNFPLELKVLNGISKLESLQSLKKQKRKPKRNNTTKNGISRRSRKIQKEMTAPTIKNIIDQEEEQIHNNDLVKSLFEEWEQQPEFENQDLSGSDNYLEQAQQCSLMDEENQLFENGFFNEGNFLLADNQIPQQLEVVHNPNDSTRDKTKITELHQHIQMIESMLCDTKQQLEQIME